MSYGLDTISGLIAFVIIGNRGLRGRSRINRLIVLLFGRSPSIAIGTDLQYPTLKKPLYPLLFLPYRFMKLIPSNDDEK